MITSYVTKSGTRLELGRIPRRELDKFLSDNPEPEPPVITREVQVWGEGLKKITREDREDPEFIKLCEIYYLLLFEKQIDILSRAVTVIDEIDERQLDAIYTMRIQPSDRHSDLIKYVVLSDGNDAKEVSRIIIYNSTVTAQGIDEAKRRFNVTWRKNPIRIGEDAKSPAEFSGLYDAMRSAKFSGLNWLEFCELTGPQQSEIVAFYQTEEELRWLSQNNQ